MIAKGGIMISINICRAEAGRGGDPCEAGRIQYPLLPFAELPAKLSDSGVIRTSHRGKSESDSQDHGKSKLQEKPQRVLKGILYLVMELHARDPRAAGATAGSRVHLALACPFMSLHLCLSFPIPENPPFQSELLLLAYN